MTEIEGLIKKELWSAPCALSSRIEASGKALLAVSGGMDSMCLADLFLRIYGPSGFATATSTSVQRKVTATRPW